MGRNLDPVSRLSKGAQQLGLALDVSQVEKLLAYQSLLQKWNRVYNLTAIRAADEMLTHHLLDSLAAVPLLRQWATRDGLPARVLDVGSGGGLPGIPLAVVAPELEVTMADIVQKKTAFLTQCKAELGLANARVHWGRVEELSDALGYGVITSRAFAELTDFVTWAGHLVAPGGHFVAMKGVYPEEEIQALPSGWCVKSIERLEVPELSAERHLVVIGRAD
jgi:16S rRNA (guanine527-N7)-methyltransferase